jgi:transposase
MKLRSPINFRPRHHRSDLASGARHMRVSLSTMRNKTDRNDARGIAQMMRLGWYRAVHVKNIDMQKMRTLLSNRKLLKRKLIDIENHIHGALRAYGLLVGAVARGAYEAGIRELLERSDPIFAMTIEAMLDVRRRSSRATSGYIACSCKWSSMILSVGV